MISMDFEFHLNRPHLTELFVCISPKLPYLMRAFFFSPSKHLPHPRRTQGFKIASILLSVDLFIHLHTVRHRHASSHETLTKA